MVGRFIQVLIDIIYPKTCIVCRQSLKEKPHIDNRICLPCWSRIKKNTPPFCRHCGRHLPQAHMNTCGPCMRSPFSFDRAFSPCVYEGVIKELIHAFKYRGTDYLGDALSGLMIDFIKEFSIPMDYIDLILPVPLYPTRLREREFNQAEVLCRNLSRHFSKETLRNVLRRRRHTKTQTELTQEERRLNVKGCFTVATPQKVQGKNILLVDDVFTTGATVSEAASSLKTSGAGIVFVLTLAH
jgi:competence protein ComFC